MLTDRIRLSGPDANDPEDILYSSLGVIFPDDIANQHGDSENAVIYLSSSFGEITLSLADLPFLHHIGPPTLSERNKALTLEMFHSPQGEDNRRLFSHFLWNAGLQLAEFIEEFPAQWVVQGQRVLELGAGTGLAGIVASLMGAQSVVVSDYPAPEVLANIAENISRNVTSRSDEVGKRWDIRAQGHEWGKFSDEFCEKEEETFDKVLVADCLWMPWQHANLLKSLRWFLKDEGRAWIFAGFHTGREKMRGFYEESFLKEHGMEIERIYEKNADGAEREWVKDRGIEDVTERKRWLVIAVLRRLVG